MIERYLTTGPDPYIRETNLRVSIIMGYKQATGSEFDRIAEDFGLSNNAVLACAGYYMQHRDEIRSAIEQRNRAYQAAAQGHRPTRYWNGGVR